MSDEDLEILITLDDPPYAPEEDIFDHRSRETHSPGEFGFSPKAGE
jgi:hypothetical protein